MPNIPPTIFTKATPQFLTGSYNQCAPDWKEDNVRYNFHKLYYFQQGEAKLTIENHTYYPQPGQLFIIPAGIKHSYSHNKDNPVIKYWCHFDLTFGETVSINHVPEAACCTPDAATMIPLFQKLLDAASKPQTPSAILLLKAALLELLAQYFDLLTPMLDRLFEKPTQDFAYLVQEYTRQNLSSSFTVVEMAKAFHLQPNYFIQKFKKSFQQTPVQYRNQVRLEAAADQIVRLPDKKLEIVAADCGFEDYRYFSRLFKKRYGVTPSVYRSYHPFDGLL